MSRTLVMLLLATVLAVYPAAAARADGEDKEKIVTELDASANPAIYQTHFTRYGFEFLKTIRFEGPWVRIHLPADGKGVGQTGLYSYVALAGDFEMEMAYAWVELPQYKKGYGMSCGFAVDSKTEIGFVALARNFNKGKGASGYAIVKGWPVEKDWKYDTKVLPGVAPFVKKGRLVMRREKDELVCLATDTKEELQELTRVPFTAKTVRQVRFYGDAGGSPSELDVWLGKFRVKAEEITGGFPQREQPGVFPWWIIPTTLLTLAAGGGWLAMRQRARKLD